MTQSSKHVLNKYNIQPYNTTYVILHDNNMYLSLISLTLMIISLRRHQEKYELFYGIIILLKKIYFFAVFS